LGGGGKMRVPLFPYFEKSGTHPHAELNRSSSRGAAAGERKKAERRTLKLQLRWHLDGKGGKNHPAEFEKSE